MSKKIIFIGAGAIGSYLGAFLARDGHDVTLIDPWPEQVEAIKANGIYVSGPHDPFNARPTAVHLHEAQSLDGGFDIAFVTMKSRDTAWATHFVKRFLNAGGYVVSAQNCWNDPTIASIMGAERAVGLIMSRISVAVWEPGKVSRGVEKGSARAHTVFRAGEHDGKITPRTVSLAQMLSCIDAAEATDNLWGERWAKLCQNSMGNPVAAMTGLGSQEVGSMPGGRRLSIGLACESAKVGLALGYRVPKFGGVDAGRWASADQGDVFEELDAMLAVNASSSRNWRASMPQDVLKKRRSEIDYMNGHVVAGGREAGVPTPLSAAVVDIMHEIDAGTLAPAQGNIDRALASVGR